MCSCVAVLARRSRVPEEIGEGPEALRGRLLTTLPLRLDFFAPWTFENLHVLLHSWTVLEKVLEEEARAGARTWREAAS